MLNRKYRCRHSRKQGNRSQQWTFLNTPSWHFPRRCLKKLNTLKSPVQWSILVRMHQQKRDAFFTLQRTFAWISPAEPDGWSSTSMRTVRYLETNENVFVVLHTSAWRNRMMWEECLCIFVCAVAGWPARIRCRIPRIGSETSRSVDECASRPCWR